MNAAIEGRAVEISSSIEDQASSFGIPTVRAAAEAVQHRLRPAPVLVGRHLEHGPEAMNAAFIARAVEIAGGIQDQSGERTKTVRAVEAVQYRLVLRRAGACHKHDQGKYRQCRSQSQGRSALRHNFLLAGATTVVTQVGPASNLKSKIPKALYMLLGTPARKYFSGRFRKLGAGSTGAPLQNSPKSTFSAANENLRENRVAAPRLGSISHSTRRLRAGLTSCRRCAAGL